MRKGLLTKHLIHILEILRMESGDQRKSELVEGVLILSEYQKFTQEKMWEEKTDRLATLSSEAVQLKSCSIVLRTSLAF